MIPTDWRSWWRPVAAIDDRPLVQWQKDTPDHAPLPPPTRYCSSPWRNDDTAGGDRRDHAVPRIWPRSVSPYSARPPRHARHCVVCCAAGSIAPLSGVRSRPVTRRAARLSPKFSLRRRRRAEQAAQSRARSRRNCRGTSARPGRWCDKIREVCVTAEMHCDRGADGPGCGPSRPDAASGSVGTCRDLNRPCRGASASDESGREDGDWPVQAPGPVRRDGLHRESARAAIPERAFAGEHQRRTRNRRRAMPTADRSRLSCAYADGFETAAF